MTEMTVMMGQNLLKKKVEKFIDIIKMFFSPVSSVITVMEQIIKTMKHQ